MVCAQVIGNDVVITIANELGNFELNVMLPIIAYNLLQSIFLLGNISRLFAEKVVEGFTVNQRRISGIVDQNPVLITTLNLLIGYDKVAEIARKAHAEGRSLKDVAAEMTNLPQEELDRLLDPTKIADGGIV